MKKYLKLLTFVVVAFVMMVGIKVNAAVANDYYLYSDGAQIRVYLPIHKTDTNKKALEGVEFTLKDFNNTISYKSSDEKDGDYLITIEENSYNPVTELNVQEMQVKREDADVEYKIIDETGDDEVLTKILDLVPSKYSDVFRKAQSSSDLYDMLDLPVYVINEGSDYYYVGFYVPLKVEETKVPAGYKAKNIVIPAFVTIGFDYGYVYASLSYTPGYYSLEPFEMIPAYFEYNEGTDYEAIFDKINNKLSRVDSDEELFELFEDNGAIVDDDCDIQSSGGSERKANLEIKDVEEKFSSDVEELLCPINLVDEKEDIIVNPETAGTIGIVTLLIVISSAVVMYTRKVKNN